MLDCLVEKRIEIFSTASSAAPSSPGEVKLMNSSSSCKKIERSSILEGGVMSPAWLTVTLAILDKSLNSFAVFCDFIAKKYFELPLKTLNGSTCKEISS